GVEAIARFVPQPGKAIEVDADQLAVALHHLARDQHGVHVLRTHAGDDSADRVVHGHDIEPVGAQQDDVRSLARGEGADLAIQTVRPRTLYGGELQHLAHGEELRRVTV